MKAMNKSNLSENRSRVIARPFHSRSFFGFLLGVCFLMTSCGSEPPEGVPIDLEAIRQFKPFSLRDLDGQVRSLEDFLDRLTLVTFFFPT